MFVLQLRPKLSHETLANHLVRCLPTLPSSWQAALFQRLSITFDLIRKCYCSFLGDYYPHILPLRLRRMVHSIRKAVVSAIDSLAVKIAPLFLTACLQAARRQHGVEPQYSVPVAAPKKSVGSSSALGLTPSEYMLVPVGASASLHDILLDSFNTFGRDRKPQTNGGNSASTTPRKRLPRGWKPLGISWRENHVAEVHGMIVVDLKNKGRSGGSLIELRSSSSAPNAITVFRSQGNFMLVGENDGDKKTKSVDLFPGESLSLQVGDVLEVGKDSRTLTSLAVQPHSFCRFRLRRRATLDSSPTRAQL